MTVHLRKEISANRDARAARMESPAFRAWFRDSQVVDRWGRPRVVYHGTHADFDAFGKTADIGFHFGSAEQAEDICRQALDARGRKIGMAGARILPVYLSLQNPLRLEDDPKVWNAAYVVESAIPKGILSREEVRELSRRSDAALRWAHALFDRKKGTTVEWGRLWGGENAKVLSEIRGVLQAKGYDGLIYANDYEGRRGRLSYVAFEPAQVKSVFNARAWDPRSADLLDRLPEPEPEPAPVACDDAPEPW